MTSTGRLADAQRTFVAPPGLAHSQPRDVELTAAGRALVALAVVLFAAAIGAGVAMSQAAQRQAERGRVLVADGLVTTGHVTRLWPSGGNSRRVIYAFIAGGRLYTGDERVSADRRRLLGLGAPLRVRYAPANPQVNDLGGVPRVGIPMWLPFVVAIGIAALGLACLLALNHQRQLLAEGRLAPAIITGYQQHRTSEGATQRSLTYEFRLLNGVVAQGKAPSPQKPSASGSVICIVYDPDRPSRSLVYPFSLVRPVA